MFQRYRRSLSLLVAVQILGLAALAPAHSHDHHGHDAVAAESHDACEHHSEHDSRPAHDEDCAICLLLAHGAPHDVATTHVVALGYRDRVCLPPTAPISPTALAGHRARAPPAA